MDRISELPEITQQHILTFLTIKDSARTTILSKKWLHLWRTRSVLHFNQIYFRKLGSPQDGQELGSQKFIQFVDNTLVRHHEQGIRIKEFKIQINRHDGKIYPLLDKWFKIAVDEKVEVIQLSINKSLYVLPNQIFEAKSLIELNVFGRCMLSLGNNTTLKCHDLKKLRLGHVVIDDGTIQNIVCNCPLIEEISLLFITGLRRVRVVGLSNLKIFSISTFTKLQELCIEAPMLQCYRYEYFYESEPPMAYWFNFEASQNLKYLSLTRVSITDMDLHKLLSQSPYLVDLRLSHCDMLDKINVSSHLLERFSLSRGKKLVEVIIDCPNLLSLVYSGLKLSQLSFASPLGQGKLEMRIVDDSDHMDFSKFYELREFLTKFNVSSVSLLIQSRNMTFTEEWRSASFPPAHEIEKLKLDIAEKTPASTYPIFVDGLFWSCHPKTISVDRCRSEEHFIKFLCKELMERGDGNCCSSSEIKCWRHHLLYFEIKSFDKIRREWKPVPGKVLTDGSVNFEHLQAISFTLEWGELGPKVHEVKEVDEQKLTNGNDQVG